MRIWHWSLALLGPLALALPAWAEEAGGGHGGEEGGLPPFLMPDTAAIVVAIATFLLLLFILTKLAWKPILNGLQKREDTIRQAIDDARKANEEARGLAAQYEEKLDHAKEEAQAIADEARRDAEEIRRRIEEDARVRAEETLARSVREIGQAKDKAFDELLRDVAAIAAEAATRIVRREITPEANAPLVDEVVEDFVRSRGGDSA